MNAIDEILSARSAQELFGAGDPALTYKKLQRQVHPDLNPSRSGDATAAFVKLTELYRGFGKVETVTFTTKKGTWTTVTDVWRSSGVRYRALQGTEDTWVAYVSSAGASGGFTEGHRILENLGKDLLEEDLKNTTTHRYFFPRVMDKFKLGDQRKEARVLSAEVPGSRWFPLSSWSSLAPQDIAWIARRGLVALQLLHSHGYLHGSPHLEAFIVEPEQHGVMLKDWQYALRMGDPLGMVDPRAVAAYPSWAKEAKATASGAIDLMVFGHGFEELSRSSHAPLWFQEFFTKLKKNPSPTAEQALQQFTELLDRHWERKFHPMSYPR